MCVFYPFVQIWDSARGARTAGGFAIFFILSSALILGGIVYRYLRGSAVRCVALCVPRFVGRVYPDLVLMPGGTALVQRFAMRACVP